MKDRLLVSRAFSKSEKPSTPAPLPQGEGSFFSKNIIPHSQKLSPCLCKTRLLKRESEGIKTAMLKLSNIYLSSLNLDLVKI
jgi:hypothetical protein